MNGGFPPLIIKKNSKLKDNKERTIASTIKNNVNIFQILESKIKKDKEKEENNKNKEKKIKEEEILEEIEKIDELNNIDEL